MYQSHERSKAIEFEALIRSGIAAQGVEGIARKMGLHHTAISKMQAGKNCFVERAAKLLDAIGFMGGEKTVIFKGEDTEKLAKALVLMMEHIKSEAPAAGTVEASDGIYWINSQE